MSCWVKKVDGVYCLPCVLPLTVYPSGSQTFLKFRLCRPQKFFSITHGPLFLSINFPKKSREEPKEKSHHVHRCPIFHAKSSEEQKKAITSAGVQSSTVQLDNLSKIRYFFAIPLKLLRGPKGDRGPQFENHCLPKHARESILSLIYALVVFQSQT